MHFSQNFSNYADFRPQKSKSKNKMIKTRNTHTQKSSLKHVSKSSHKASSEISYRQISPNFLIKQKYFRPAIKQYQKADANMITRCICKDFDSFEDRTMDFFEFVKFYSVKENLKKYQSGVLQNFHNRFLLISLINYFNQSIARHIFHFYDKSFHILKNRVMKLKNLQIHNNVLKEDQGSSTKNSDKKNPSKSKSKQKIKHMDNVLKGIFMTDGKQSQRLTLKPKVRKVNKMSEPRKTHILSRDSQEMCDMLNDLSQLLRAHSIKNYNQMNTWSQIIPSTNDFQSDISSVFGLGSIPQNSRVKEIAKHNEFTEIMQSQSSHISAIKNSQIVTSPDQFQFYGLSAIRDKKIKRQQKNSAKNQSYFANGESSTHFSRLTNKRTSTDFQFSHIFSQQTPKKSLINQVNIQSKQEDFKKSKSNSKTLRKGFQEKSKSKSLSSTQKSLKKDQSGGLNFRNGKLLSNAKSTKNLSQRLLFMEPLNQKNIRKPGLIGPTKQHEQRKESKSKSKGKIMILKR